MCVFYAALSMAMESELVRKSSGPLKIMSTSTEILFRTSEESASLSPQKSSTEDPYVFSFSLPSLTSLSSNFDSLKNTVTNYLWDDAAFVKLGWPMSNESAKQELKKTHDLYKKIITALHQNSSYEILLKNNEEDFKALNRRYEYCQRALNAFPSQPDSAEAVAFAQFCLRYHQQFIEYITTFRYGHFLEDKKVENKWKIINPEESLIELEALIKEKPLNIIKEDNNIILKTLGWPITDKNAEIELQKSQQLYERVNKYFQTKELYSSFLDDWKAINEKHDGCQRVLEMLPIIFKRSEALALATFCLKHHGQVMTDFDKSRFLLFVKMEEEQSKKEVAKARCELAALTIVPENNELLNHLFEQTVSVKYPKDKTETKENVKKELKKDAKK